MDRTLGRPKKEGQVVPNYQGKKTSEIIAEGTGESYKQVQRYIRLTYLIPELLEMVDNKHLAFNPAVELSYLTEDQQRDFLDAMDYAQATPSLSQAQRIKKLSQNQGDGDNDGDSDDEPERVCSLDAMCKIMNETKKEDNTHVRLSFDVLKKYFPKSYTPKQVVSSNL